MENFDKTQESMFDKNQYIMLETNLVLLDAPISG